MFLESPPRPQFQQHRLHLSVVSCNIKNYYEELSSIRINGESPEGEEIERREKEEEERRDQELLRRVRRLRASA